MSVLAVVNIWLTCLAVVLELIHKAPEADFDDN
jgi:hypothetical protein